MIIKTGDPGHKSCGTCSHNRPARGCQKPGFGTCLGVLNYSRPGNVNGFEYNFWTEAKAKDIIESHKSVTVKIMPMLETDPADIKGMPEIKTGCTCPTIKGPRMYDNPGFKMCKHCTDFHNRYFPAFPGDPAWHLNHGAINRNSWGIRPEAIKTRSHERVSDLQIEAAKKTVAMAKHELAHLEVLRDRQSKES